MLTPGSDTADITSVSGDAPDVPEARRAFVEEWRAKIEDAKLYFKPDFERMRKNMRFAREGADRAWTESDRYVANIIQRSVNQSVSSLYAKDPKVYAKRKPRMDFAVWDGKPESLAQAMQSLAAGIADPNAIALLQDVQSAESRRTMLDRVARTLQIYFMHFWTSSKPPFKTQIKQLVRRTKVCGIGYVEMSWQRVMEKDPTIVDQIQDVTERLALLERIAREVAEGKTSETDADAERLRIALSDLQSRAEIIAREGLVFEFPRSTEIIFDPACRQINGWIGAEWVAREYTMTPKKVRENFGVDIGKNFRPYKPDPLCPRPQRKQRADSVAMVWKVWDQTTGTVLYLCDGYPNLLKEPERPSVDLDRFFPIYSLSFNPVEDEDSVFPLSDVELLRPMQEEYNRNRQGLREHRMRNRPGWVAPKGRLEDEDKKNLQSNTLGVLIELNSLAPGEKVTDILQPKPTTPIDPNLYDNSPLWEDVQRVTGQQEANLGGTSKATATETSVAETSRVSTVSSNVDDLDDLLTELARDGGQVCLMEASPESVRRVVGAGAVWPEFSRSEIAEELYLTVKAGSSGRPNKAIEISNFERMAPFALQVQGLNPQWLLRVLIERLDDDVDVDEAVIAGLPSIIAMNAAMGRPLQPSTGDPETDPAQQGAEGRNNAPSPQQNEPQGQPAFPAPMALH